MRYWKLNMTLERIPLKQRHYDDGCVHWVLEMVFYFRCSALPGHRGRCCLWSCSDKPLPVSQTWELLQQVYVYLNILLLGFIETFFILSYYFCKDTEERHVSIVTADVCVHINRFLSGFSQSFGCLWYSSIVTFVCVCVSIVTADALWKGVLADTNSSKKGRGKRSKRQPKKDLNRGQVIGEGETDVYLSSYPCLSVSLLGL